MANSSNALPTPSNHVPSDASILRESFLRLMQAIDSTTNTRLNLHMISDERALLDALEEKIGVAYHASLGALRYRRNQLSHFNRLPNELLLMIFLLSKDKDVSCPWEYIHLTWICRRWRILALGHAEFWTNINLDDMEAEVVEEFMARSNGARLSVVMGIACPYVPENEAESFRLFKELIGPQFGRLESLRLAMRIDRWEQTTPILQQPAPFLRHCQFILVVGNSGFNFAILPADVFKATAPLRILKLSDVAPPWHSIRSMIHGLRQLKLLLATDPTTTWPTCEQLLHILEACPDLEMLCLRVDPWPVTPDGASVTTEDALAAPPSITMHRLSNITLLSSIDTWILCHIATPLLKRLYINIPGGPPMLPDLIARCLDLKALRMVAIGSGELGLMDNRYSFIFQGWRGRGVPISDLGTDVSDDEIEDDYFADLSLHIECYKVRLDTLQTLWPGVVAQATNVSTLVLQSFDAPAGTPLEFLTQTVRQAGNVKDLIINHQPEATSDAQPLLEVFADPLVCPELRSLTYSCTPYEKAAPGKQLVSLVKARGKEPASIKTIELLGCQPLAKCCAGQLERFGVDVQERYS